MADEPQPTDELEARMAALLENHQKTMAECSTPVGVKGMFTAPHVSQEAAWLYVGQFQVSLERAPLEPLGSTPYLLERQSWPANS